MTSSRLFVLIIFSIFVNACNNDNTPSTPPVILPPVLENGYIYLALGDSYTIGQAVDIEQRFPVQLIDSLRSRDYKMDDAQIIAQTGWTTQNLMNAIDNANITDTFDLVSLLIGVNNQFQGGTINRYRGEFRTLLEKAITLAGGDKDKVFVLSIPDYGVTPFGGNNGAQIGQEIDEFNTVNLEITDSLEVTYFNITSISRQAETDSTLIAVDNLHPSGEMYRLWVELMLNDVEAKLD